MKKKLLALASMMALLAAVMGCTGHHPKTTTAAMKQPPATTSPPAAKPSAEEAKEKALEIAIGLMVEALVSSSRGEYDDAALCTYVSEIGTRIARRSERPDLPWHFLVLDTEEISAHALPGGRVTITRGLLAFLSSEAEVAAVLAHEIAHVAFRHSHSKWSPSAAVAEIGSTADERERLRDADQERQADTVGARYLSSAGYDPRAMVDALSAVERGATYMLAQREKSKKDNSKDAIKVKPEEEEEDNSDSFDPHPAPPTRLARAAVVAGDGGGDVGRDRYLSRIAGLEWGEGSATPLLIGERYVVPGELSFAVPRGYKAKSDGGVLQAKVSTDDAAAALVALRLQKSIVSEALKASIGKGQHVTREILGRPALVGRFTPTPKATAAQKKKTKKSDDTIMAVVDGPTTVLIVVVNGNSPASEKVLDGFLASAERDTKERPRRMMLVAIERVEAKGRFDDFVRSRCPGTPLEIATAINADGAVVVRKGVARQNREVAIGSLVKCVKGNASAK